MSCVISYRFFFDMLDIPLTDSFYKKHHRIYDSFILEYIWIDGSGNLRSKYRTAYPKFESCINPDAAYSRIPVEDWTYDASKIGLLEPHAHAHAHARFQLVPVAYYPNPFFESGRAFLILCDTYRAETETSFRCEALKAFEKGRIQVDPRPWFALEQEYFIMSEMSEMLKMSKISGTSEMLEGGYYCSVGSGTVTLRKLAEKHYEYCLHAGIKISGINAEVAPGDWNFQIGPCSGISAGDELWIARYILYKLAEEFGVFVSFKPKPLDIRIPIRMPILSRQPNGSGLCISFSTAETREKNGLKCIYKYIDRLSKKHVAAGPGIRIPNSVLEAGCGYLKDSRPASDADPYRVILAIFTTACACFD